MNRWGRAGLACLAGIFGIAIVAEAGWVDSPGSLVLDDRPLVNNSIALQGDYSAPAVGDLDGDGRQEIVAIVYSGELAAQQAMIYAWRADGSVMPGWPVSLREFYGAPGLSTITLGDVDGVRGDEVLVTATTFCRPYTCTGVVVIRFDATQLPIAPVGGGPFGEFVVEPNIPPVIGDLDRNGVNEVVTVGRQGIAVWNRSGMMAGWPINLSLRYGDQSDPSYLGVLAASPALADLNGDGSLEIIAVTQRNIYIWHRDGRDMRGWPKPAGATAPVTAAAVVADFEGSGTPAIAVALPLVKDALGVGRRNRIRIYRPNGTLISDVEREADVTPAVGDLNNDRTAGLVTAGRQGDFTVLSGETFTVRMMGRLLASPVIAKLADGSRRIYAAGDDGRLYGWDGTGKPVGIGRASTLPLELFTIPLSPTLADLTGDGLFELIVMGRKRLKADGISITESIIRVIPLGIRGTPEWATLKGSAQRTGAMPADHATFLTQVVPTRLTRGQTATVRIAMKNTGTSTWEWIAGGSTKYHLGSQNPQGNKTWGINFIDVPSMVRVAPGQRHDFSFTITAPATAGTYNFQWRMIFQRLGIWRAFGQASPNVAITVN